MRLPSFRSDSPSEFERRLISYGWKLFTTGLLGWITYEIIDMPLLSKSDEFCSEITFVAPQYENGGFQWRFNFKDPFGGEILSDTVDSRPARLKVGDHRYIQLRTNVFGNEKYVIGEKCIV